jgi:hypothetical protein
MKFWRTLSLMSLIGCALSASGCRTVVVATDPYYCPPFYLEDERIDQYALLYRENLAPAVRAWVREADRICRANNALRGDGDEPK